MALFSFNTTVVPIGQTVASSTGNTGHVAGSAKKDALIVGLFAGAWNLITGPIFFIMLYNPGRIRNHETAPLWVMTPFLLVGLALLIWAVREIIRFQKYGDPALDIDFVPAPIGGRLQGRITLVSPVNVAPPFVLTLSCVHRKVSGSGKNRSVSETIVYHDEQTATALPGGIIPVAFDIPPDAQESDIHDSDDCIIWRLRANAAFPGIPFIEQYDVPIGRPANLPPEQAALVVKSTAAYQAKIEHYQRPATSRIYVRPAPGGKTEFFFSAGRDRGMAVGVGLVLGVALVLFVIIHNSGFSFAILLVGLVLGSLELQLLFGTMTVTIGPRDVTISKDLLGFNFGTKIIPVSDVVEFKATIGASISQTGAAGGVSSTFYDITVICRDGETKAGTGMADKMEAEALAAQMGRCLHGKT